MPEQLSKSYDGLLTNPEAGLFTGMLEGIGGIIALRHSGIPFRSDLRLQLDALHKSKSFTLSRVDLPETAQGAFRNQNTVVYSLQGEGGNGRVAVMYNPILSTSSSGEKIESPQDNFLYLCAASPDGLPIYTQQYLALRVKGTPPSTEALFLNEGERLTHKEVRNIGVNIKGKYNNFLAALLRLVDNYGSSVPDDIPSLSFTSTYQGRRITSWDVDLIDGEDPITNERGVSPDEDIVDDEEKL